jgi:hypothetical protein
MLVILSLALAISNILGNSLTGVEGFESGLDEPESSSDAVENKESKESKTVVPTSDSKSPSKLDKDKLADHYRELLDLQDKIQVGMQNIKEPLKEAEDIIETMKSTMGM